MQIFQAEGSLKIAKDIQFSTEFSRGDGASMDYTVNETNGSFRSHRVNKKNQMMSINQKKVSLRYASLLKKNTYKC